MSMASCTARSVALDPEEPLLGLPLAALACLAFDFKASTVWSLTWVATTSSPSRSHGLSSHAKHRSSFTDSMVVVCFLHCASEGVQLEARTIGASHLLVALVGCAEQPQALHDLLQKNLPSGALPLAGAAIR